MTDATRRSEIVATRFTKAEAADLDLRRGALSRTDFIRWLVLRARKEGVHFGGGD